MKTYIIRGWIVNVADDFPFVYSVDLKGSITANLTDEQVMSLAELYDVMIVDRSEGRIILLDEKGRTFSRR